MKAKILNIVLIVSLMLPVMPVQAREGQEEWQPMVDELAIGEAIVETEEETIEEVIQEIVEEPVLETIIENDEVITVADNVAINASNFPDINFREYIKSTIDKDHDGILTSIEIISCRWLDITAKNISSLKGIEFFVNLEDLSCGNNALTELDLRKCTNLIQLDCSYNSITKLDISGCSKLRWLYCNNNEITALDVSKCPELAKLSCDDNKISELNIENCTKLWLLDCSNNNLRSMEVGEQSGIIDMVFHSFVRSKSKNFDFSKYSSFNPGKVKILNGLTLNGKVFTLTEDSFGSGAYEYDCGNGTVLVVNLRYVKEPEAFVSNKDFPQEIRIDNLAEIEPWRFVNQGDNDYSTNTSVINSYLTINEDNTYTRVSNPLYLKDYVYLEKYSNDFQLLSTGRIKKELPEFGGFFDDGKFYYLVFGQNNPNEDDGTEVFRVVKYSHNWTRLEAASIYGANTTVPFAFGSLRFDTYDGYLYIKTCHVMYEGSHQASASMKIRIADMGLSNVAYDISYAGGYVSHSFNQFVKVDNGIVYTLDHGDKYPRAAVLYKGKANISFNQGGWEELYTLSYSDYADFHYNHTFATLGGLEVSDYAIITAGSSAPQDGVNRYYNIYITTTDKKNFSAEGTKLKWITHYTNGNTQVGNPYLVEINKNKYMLMWTEKDAGTYDGNLQLKYVLLDGKGNMVGNVITRQGVLSDCQPIYDSKTNQIIWYVVNNKGEISFYTIGTWPFTDVAVKSGNWKYEAVKYVYDNKIMNGVGDGTRFDPDAPLTREMFATVLYRMAGEPAVTYKMKFPDVPGGKWYSNAVIWASEQGIVSGYGSGNFGTGHYITREQISKMLMEYGDKQGYDVSQSANFNSFADAGKVSGWAKDYMKWAVGSGMIGGSQKNGKYYLNPQGNATRAECATMLKRFMEKY